MATRCSGYIFRIKSKQTDKLTVNYGGRFDQVNAYVNEHQFSPRLGLVYKRQRPDYLARRLCKLFHSAPDRTGFHD